MSLGFSFFFFRRNSCTWPTKEMTLNPFVNEAFFLDSFPFMNNDTRTYTVARQSQGCRIVLEQGKTNLST